MMSVHGQVMEILLDNPPVNALGASLRRSLAEALAAARSDANVTAIVIRGAGRLFSGGADITEFGQPPIDPVLAEMIREIEACPKPVIAAIHGMALGGGLEVALACHYRISTAEARLGLPEVKLGLIPGAGGTQRLPRLIGAEAALDMIVSGEPVNGAQALELGLVDRLADGDSLATSAIAWAGELTLPRRTRELAVSGSDEAVERFVEANGRKFKGIDAPQACVEAIRAALRLPLAEGFMRERELFASLVAGEQSKALRHMFFAERAAAKIEGLPDGVTLRDIRRVGIIGAGTMGGGIAMNFLSAGIPVTLVEMNADALERGVGVMRGNYEASAAKRRISPQQVEAAMALLEPTLQFESLAQCDLVIEAVYEDMAVKKDVFERLDAIARPGAILATNTSYLDVDEIAGATRRPQDVVGLHFFSPANVMKLLEVVRGARTADDVLATAMALARRIGKVAVVAGVCHGFIGNRMLTPRQANATRLVMEGASPEQVDLVHTGFGMPMGPFQMGDLAGIDIGWHRDPERIESLKDALCAKGRWGQKTKAGYYDYDDRRKPSPSPVVDAIITQFRERLGTDARIISDEEIVVRTLYTMVNEGAKILAEDIAQRASDIDVVWHYGYGWPRQTGGPMFWAERIGLSRIVADLDRYADRMGADFEVSPYLREAAEAGSFHSRQFQPA